MQYKGRSVKVTPTPIEGLVLVEMPIHADSRGWFKEGWNAATFTDAGLPHFRPVQQNLAHNLSVGTTRGLHAEPWDKLVSVASGRCFGAWVDLRPGTGFGRVWSTELDPSRAVLVPRGVANSYQTLEPNTDYVYLVNDHWSPGTTYPAVALDCPELAIDWPIPLDQAVVSDKDRANPPLKQVEPMPPRRVLVTGAAGQLGLALRRLLGEGPQYDYTDADTLDITSPNLAGARRWRDYGTIINAAAYTSVDDAETAAGRELAWRINLQGPANLAALAQANDLVLVHVSSDYVFGGTGQKPIDEHRPFAPLGVYGATKAAGDAAVQTCPRHYVVRTSWLVGQGKNFVTTMASLAQRGASPSVVNDQFGRLTFTDDLAQGIVHLLSNDAPYGTYNLTNDGPATSWFDVAQQVFGLVGADPQSVHPVSTEQYIAGLGDKSVAPRPAWSVLDLAKIRQTGFCPRAAGAALRSYLG